MKNQRKMLVTYALPYANGDIHLGHMTGFIQTDIFVRYQKMHDTICYFICGSDAHGTPIMLAAEKAGITAEQLIANVGHKHLQDCHDFYIEFDNFYTTHSPEDRQLSEEIFQALRARGDIEIRQIEQAFDATKNMFLPDRYVKGECPRCGAADQYGDNCEVCGAAYAPTDLKNPISVLSGTPPILKKSEHLFFVLEHYRDALTEWTKSGSLQPEVVNKLNEWLQTTLHSWDISRDAPYFGFEIPGFSEKYFYVWLDAPVGYMASFMNLCKREKNIDFNEFWRDQNNTELYHFVGKDIVYFHALFWPAMLMGANFRLPTAVYSHGFLTVNGQKMSKSRGTFIKARTYLNHLDPEYLRYYFATKLTSTVDDLDLNLEDFVAKVNSDIVGKLVNIASRCVGFIHKYFDGVLASQMDHPELFEEIAVKSEFMSTLYESRDFARVTREVMEMADRINQYIDEKKPWQLAKHAESLADVHKICTTGLNLFRQLIIFLKPILPVLAGKAEKLLNVSAFTWRDISCPLLNHHVNPFEPLMTRIDPEKILALKAEATADLG